MDIVDLIAGGIIIFIVVNLGFAIYENYQREECDKETVCYYFVGGGLFDSQHKIYVDCDNNFVGSQEKIIKERVYKKDE